MLILNNLSSLKKDFFNKFSQIKLLTLYYMVSFAIICTVSTIVAYNYGRMVNSQIDKILEQIKDEIDSQIYNVSELLQAGSNHAKTLINIKAPKKEMKDLLESLDPGRYGRSYISTFILIGQNSNSFISSKYSTHDKFQTYRTILNTREYFQNTQKDFFKVYAGEVVRGIQTNKLSIPVGIGIGIDGKYHSTLVAGIVIEEFIKDLIGKKGIIDIKFVRKGQLGNAMKPSDYNNFRIFREIFSYSKPSFEITYDLDSIPNSLNITFDKKFFRQKFYSLLTPLFATIFFVLIGFYCLLKYLIHNIINPIIKKLDNLKSLISLPYYEHSLKPIEIRNLEVFIKTVPSLIENFESHKEQLNQIRTTVKFLASEQIKNIESQDPKGFELFKKMEEFLSIVNDEGVNIAYNNYYSQEFKLFCNDLNIFYKSLQGNIPGDLFTKIENLLLSAEDSSTKHITRTVFLNQINELHISLKDFYKKNIPFSPYIINQSYFQQLEEIKKFDIKDKIKDIVEKYHLTKYKISCDVIKIKADNFSIYEKAFDLSFIYAIEALLDFYNYNDNIEIALSIIGGEDRNSLLNINFRASINHIKNDSTSHSENNLKESTNINLYGCKIFAAFNSGIVNYNLDEVTSISIDITYLYSNLSK